MRLIALDIETTGLNPRTDTIHGVGIYEDEATQEYYRHDDPILRTILSDGDVHIVGHNIRFDLSFLEKAGYEIKCQVWDTKVLAQLVDENQSLGLKDLSLKYLGVDSLQEKRDLDRAISKAKVKHVGDLCRVDINHLSESYYELIKRYCLEDCRNTLQLFHVLKEKIKKIDRQMKDFGFAKSPLDYYMEEALPTEHVLRKMEHRGIAIDVPALRAYREQLAKENDHIHNQLAELCKAEIGLVEDHLYQAALQKRKSEKGKSNVKESSKKFATQFNWQSGDHLAALIFGAFGVSRNSVEKTTTGKASTSESSLAKLSKGLPKDRPLKNILGLYAKWKKNIKLLTTYTGEKKGLLSHVENGRIYASYLQAGRGKEGSKGGTVTGRLSSRSPNMMNLPRGSIIKSFFKPDPGHVFIYFDYSQLELRLAAHLSGDELLIKAYNEGLDLHQLTADSIGEPRQVGKTTNFAMIYDASAWRLSQILEKSPYECEQIIDNFYDLYSGYKNYLAKQRQFMGKYGLVVSELGRIRRLADLQTFAAGTREWKHALKQGYNFPIQGLGASITKRAMIALDKAGYDIVTQVHDSVVIQVASSPTIDAEIHKIRQIAEGIYPLKVPLKVDIKVLTSLLESDTLIKSFLNGGITNGRTNC